MNNILTTLTEILTTAFKAAGFEVPEAKAQVCSLPELGDFQCQTALSLARTFRMAPIAIAEKVTQHIAPNAIIKSCTAVAPGYINIFLSDEFLEQSVENSLETLGHPLTFDTRRIVVDYGGANVAKPLHVGHLRAAVIGESIKRISAYVGADVIGDVHLGDWGLQIGMVISSLARSHPDWPYFNEKITSGYPENSPISIQDLETIYPQASAAAKADETLMKAAQTATVELQNGRPGYVALWQHILNVSKADLKKNYDALNVHFELWLGESDSQKYYDSVIAEIVQKGFAYESQGALIVDVEKPEDTAPVPPFMLKKSDGGVAYSTTDLATIVQRDKELSAKRIIYVVDKRQGLHFEQVFRCTKKTGVASPDLQLDFAGFGTMNGKDGKPYKTREGGVMQLEVLINSARQKAEEKILEAKGSAYTPEEMALIADRVAISALKFADLSIFRTKDYIFDLDKFCSFEGKTGPYLLYTITRAKSILKKAGQTAPKTFCAAHCPRQILMALLGFKASVLEAYQTLAPSALCDYVYKLANLFNTFYNSCNIISESDPAKKSSWLYLTNAVIEVMEKSLNLLAIKTLDKM